MHEPISLLSFVVIAIIFNATPGPSIFFISSIGAQKGRKVAFFSALGLSTGSVIHALLAGFGVSQIISNNETASLIIAIVGGTYVIYLGLSGLLNSQPNSHENEYKPDTTGNSNLGSFLQGIYVEFLNPKTFLFYTSVLAGLLTIGNYTAVEATLIALIIPATALPIDLFFGVAGGYISNASKSNKFSSGLLTGLSSFSLIGIGAYLLWSNLFTQSTAVTSFLI